MNNTLIHRAPKVALLIETSRGYGRGLLGGISKYSRLHGPWQFYLTPGDFEQIVPKMKAWNGTGIIARVMDKRTVDLVLKMGIPAIFLDMPQTGSDRLSTQRKPGYLELSSDSPGAATLIAQSFLEKQFYHFAYVGYRDQVWSQLREESYVAELRRHGREVHVYAVPTRTGSTRKGPNQKIMALRWELEEHHLVRWLSALPKPIGLMACNDQRGREVLEACEVAGIAVPEEIAVIGVDNDELLCDLSYPPLSSVAMNTEQGGYLAAKSLDEMMQRKTVEIDKIIVSPLRIVERRSSEVIAIDDPVVATAMQLIHTQPASSLSVAILARNLAISRRALELKFKHKLGRTILQEIHAVRLKRACKMLQETDMSIPQIAELTGFSSPSYLIQVFRSELGMTPAKYRKSIR